MVYHIVMLCLQLLLCIYLYPSSYFCLSLHLCCAVLYFILFHNSEAVFPSVAGYWMRHFHTALFIRDETRLDKSLLYTNGCDGFGNPTLVLAPILYCIPALQRWQGDTPISLHFTHTHTHIEMIGTCHHTSLHYVILSFWDAMLSYLYLYL